MKSRRIAFASGRVSSTPCRPTAVWKNCPSARASSRATSTKARASLATCPAVAVAMSLEFSTDSRFTLFIVTAEIAAMTSTAIADVSTISLVPIFILLKVPLMFCLRFPAWLVFTCIVPVRSIPFSGTRPVPGSVVFGRYSRGAACSGASENS